VQLDLIRLLASGAFAEVYEVETLDERHARLAAKVCRMNVAITNPSPSTSIPSLTSLNR
jgi:hypothetical protein